MSERILDVYLGDNYVGQLKQNRAGALIFTYDEQYAAQNSMGISIALPIQTGVFEGNKVEAFFSGLLPEEGVKHRLAAYLGLSEKNTLALLEVIGGDCAGALALYPPGQKPSSQLTNNFETLDSIKLQEVLKLIKRHPMLAGEDGYRLSLAGAQNKLAVGFENNHVILIKGGKPTTHILKPMIEDLEDSVHNELFCMRLAKMVGLDVPEASLHYADDVPYYLVKRYDRIRDKEGVVQRLHQEDFCQAQGVVPNMKYEREGGPSIATCQNIITHYTTSPAVSHIQLLARVIFNYLIGNADAHGKNFSLLYRDGRIDLAPAYDLLSTAAYPELSRKMAMKIGGKYKPEEVRLRNWYKLVPETQTARSELNKQLQSIAEKVQAQAILLQKQLLQEGVSSPVFDKIQGVIQVRAKRIVKQSGKMIDF